MNGFRYSGFRKKISGKIKTICYGFVLIAAFFSTASRGQDAAAPANQSANANSAPAANASPTPIPFSDIIAQTESAASTVQEIASSAASAQEIDAIEGKLSVLIDEINARLKETAQTVAGSTSLDNLRTIESDWRALTKNLPDWNNDLTARAKKLETDLEQLDELTKTWQKTLDNLKSAGETPPEVLARIQEIIRNAAETRRAIVQQQSRVVSLQNQIAEQQNRVDETLKTIRTRRNALVGQLLVQDSPPIWSASLWQKANIRQGVSKSLSTQFQGLYAFAARNKTNLILHILVFLLLAGILVYLRRRARPLVKENPELKQAAVVFYLPISTALVLAIIFSSRFYPQTPQILSAIFGAVALVPTVIILRKLINRALYPLLYSLVVFYFFDQLRVIVDDVPALVRPLFLTEMLAAVLFFLWLYRARLSEAETADEKHGRLFNIIRIASLVVIPFFAAAFLANAFGYVNLARLVGDAVLRSAYAAVILYAAVRIIDGLLVFALRFRPLNLLKMVRDYAPVIQEKLKKFIFFVAFLLWLLITLESFTLRDAVFSEARALLTAKLNIGSLSISAGDVILFFLVVWAAFKLSRFIRFALEEDVYPRFTLAHGIPYAISTIINYLILLLGFFFAVGAAGLDLTRLTVLVGAFGVGIGFGLQNIFNNFVSGLILLFERPVKVGDDIKIGDDSGVVRRIGIRASRIRQWDNSEIIVPNSKLISENVKNNSFPSRKRGIEIPVSVSHTTDTELITKLLKQVARENPDVAERPEPQVILREIVTPTLNFKLRVWTTQTESTLKIAGELAIAISRKLSENNIEVPQVSPMPSK